MERAVAVSTQRRLLLFYDLGRSDRRTEFLQIFQLPCLRRRPLPTLPRWLGERVAAYQDCKVVRPSITGVSIGLVDLGREIFPKKTAVLLSTATIFGAVGLVMPLMFDRDVGRSHGLGASSDRRVDRRRYHCAKIVNRTFD